MTVTTPTLRVATRRSLFWIIAGVFLVLIAAITLVINGAARGASTPFSATDPSPKGSKAIAEVLRQQGVTVTVTATLRDTERALAAHPSTLFLADPNSLLTAARLERIAAPAQHLVIAGPTFTQLRALAPDVRGAGKVSKASLAADCSVPAVRAAGSVTGTGSGLRLDPTSDATGCLESRSGVFSLVQRDTITLLGATAALSNEKVDERGNAALVLTLLGQDDHLVWYLPTADDAGLGGGPTIAQLTPSWVGPVLVLLIITALTAAIWRGRRFGPLVIENLPVVVRASETMEGRARLYQRGAARLHALDALRIGTVSRLAAACGLPRTATVTEVIDAVAGITARPAHDIRSLLIDTAPTNDRDLVRLSDALLELERAAVTALTPTDDRPKGE
ncbi:DUF4350 domain-containing protein [Lacisediminihabitans changchengi]|uniref:DUF4350 domain-containing protein n=1 Tax=Lacisediminihabitans changchengi TaxID=2787634 RepID=A0A934SQP3_9MICO|nr:DUF4350 domain-containing protein [Lacisediminihabitans changchengi]MBK4346409.1 DUF4350 domain-containing protein [Lacisediminihabitans changchengi]